MAISANQAIGQALGASGAPGSSGLSREQLRQLGYSDEAITQAIQLFGQDITQQAMRLLQDEIDRRQALLSDPTQYLQDLYEEYLGREVDPSGLAFYLSPAQQKQGWEAIRRSIAGSAEAKRHGSVNRMWDPSGFAGIGADQLGHMSQGDWSKLLDLGEAFAAATGWEAFPSAVDLYNLYQSGKWLDQQQAFSWFSQNALTPDQRRRMPWAASGLSAQAYHSKRDQFIDGLSTYTGTRDVPDESTLQQAIGEGWSTQRWLDHYLNDAGFQSRYGWVKFGYTYQGFQQYKLQNRQHIVARYGATAAERDTAYLADLTAPLQSYAATSSGVRSGQQSNNPDAQSPIR